MSVSKAVSLQRQEQVEALMRQGKTTKEIAAALGISTRAVTSRLSSGKIRNFQEHQQKKFSETSRSPQKPEEVDSDEDIEEAATFAAEVPPAEANQASFLDRAKAKLGLAPEKNVEPHVQVQSRKLTTGQQEFVTLATPIAKQVVVSGSRQLWTKIAGEEKAPFLVPSKEDAESIMVPLCRVLARTLSIEFKGKVTPNQLDIAASLAAVAAYAGASWELYSKMKKEEERYGYSQQEEAYNGNDSLHARGNISRGVFTSDRQNGHVAASNGAVHGADVEEIQAGSGHPGYPGDAGGVDTRNFTAAERSAYEKLNRLRALDYESRRRRSGYAAGL